MLLTIRNAAQVLDLFTVEQPEHGVSEVARKLGMSKSKAHALLASLVEAGLLRKSLNGNRYQVGWRALALARVIIDSVDFQRFARPTIRTLSRQLNETVYVAMLADGVVRYVYGVDGRQPVRVAVSTVGSIFPAHATAVGKVMLAYLSDEEIDSVIAAEGLPALTPRTITDPDTLKQELQVILRHGYATERDEAAADVSAVAAPVVGLNGVPIVAIGITVPTYRFAKREEMLRSAIVNMTRTLARVIVEEEDRQHEALVAV